ncbi:MAG: hypothetical protein LBD80_06965 [Tannerella sp.]|nr:hypothetical protein [Tannerella sp.]
MLSANIFPVFFFFKFRRYGIHIVSGRLTTAGEKIHIVSGRLTAAREKIHIVSGRLTAAGEKIHIVSPASNGRRGKNTAGYKI